MAYRAMKPALAREYIERLVDRYSDRVLRYLSVDNILPKEYVSELFDGFEPRPGVSIFYEVKADLGQASLRTLAKAGVTEVQPGIESLYTPTLKRMRKGTSSMHNVSFLDDCNQLGVHAYWNLLIGFPGETADSYQHYERVIPDLHHLAPPSGAYPVRFDRFSPYFVEAKEYGLDLEPLDFYSSIYPFSPDVLRHLAYYFSDRNYAADYIRTVAAWVGPLNRLIADWLARHEGRDHKPRATLHGTRDSAGTWTVVDTRSGETKHFVASAAVSKLIDRMQRPLQTDALAAELRPALDELRRRRLVFEERERAISLVRVGVHDSANRALAWQRESKPLGVVRQSDIAPSVAGPA
jgi:magnesium-protoporphyrin IX monomethyl ester (oxidative) cyclase